MNTAISAAGLYWELKGAWIAGKSMPGPVPGSKFGRQGGSKFVRRGHTMGDSAREMARAIVHPED